MQILMVLKPLLLMHQLETVAFSHSKPEDKMRWSTILMEISTDFVFTFLVIGVWRMKHF
jgi:hypothetical protein